MNLIVNSTANDPQKLSREELSESVDLRGLEKRLDIRQQEEDVEGIRRLGRLAVKYMGKQNGFQVQNTKYFQQKFKERSRNIEYSQYIILNKNTIDIYYIVYYRILNKNYREATC